MTLGAQRTGDGKWTFTVWAPHSSRVSVRIEDAGREQAVALDPAGCGYHVGTVDAFDGEPTYRYALDDGRAYADPASRRQPDGVHGPSQAFDPTAYAWGDGGFTPAAPSDLVIYELHVGTFTDTGTLDGAIEHLDELADLGINAVEPMPIAAFPGRRNWGYDGVFPFAVHEGYGGPAGFQRFVDACHQRGLAVILDVVYNHLGPEGAVHASFGPYLTDTYTTPWGPAMNFSLAGSDEVRRYFSENALMWLRDFHVDGLRFDAIHGIVDPTASPFLAETTRAITALSNELGKRLIAIAESGSNDPLVVAEPTAGGLGFDQQWNDDFHHALHAFLTDERDGYYQDYGSLEQIAEAFRHGFVFRGQYSHFRDKRHGTAKASPDANRLVVFAQNHDQIGNRADAARLPGIVDERRAQLATAATLLSPYIPLLFMGEEYAATTPFPYFIDHSDPDLREAVRQGRAEEFGRDIDELDPAAEATFRKARLDRRERETDRGAAMLALVRRLIELRRDVPLLRDPTAERTVEVKDSVVVVRQRRGDEEIAVSLNFAEPFDFSVDVTDGALR